MKLSTAGAGALAVLLFAAGFATRCWTERASAELAPIARGADTLNASADSLDSAIAAGVPGDSAAVAEPERAAGVHLQHAESVGDSVPLLRARTDSALARAAAADTLANLAIAALATERAAQARQVDEMRAGAADLQRGLDSAKAVILRVTAQRNEMQRQRDKARRLLRDAIAVQDRKCGPGLGAGGGYAARGPDAGLFIGYVCRF